MDCLKFDKEENSKTVSLTNPSRKTLNLVQSAQL